jgi:hypothetical protein
MEINSNNFKKNKKEFKNTVLCRFINGKWTAVVTPPDSDIVQDVDGSKIYKMNTMFSISKSNVADKSKSSGKSAPGDFLVYHIDGSLSVLTKDDYSKYFPKQPEVKQEGVVSNKVLKNKDYLTNILKNS